MKNIFFKFTLKKISFIKFYSHLSTVSIATLHILDSAHNKISPPQHKKDPQQLQYPASRDAIFFPIYREFFDVEWKTTFVLKFFFINNFPFMYKSEFLK